MKKMFFICMCFVFATSGTPAYAQALSPTSSKPVKIQHKAPNVKALPQPGELITLYVYLRHTRDTNRELRAFLTRDNKLSVLSIADSYLNEYDYPTYEITVPAPMAELSYEFALVNPDGSSAHSGPYQLRRKCLPDMSEPELNITEDISFRGKVEALTLHAMQLERQLLSYETAETLLQELHQLLDRQE